MRFPAPQPKLSIVIPCYNQAASLDETLARLVFQTLPKDDFEVIVVDDGSSDATKAVVSSFAGPYRLRFFSQDHQGAAASRNLGAANALGELLLFLDADMIAEPDLLSEHLKCHAMREKTIVIGRRKAWPPAQKYLFSKVIDIDSNVPDSLDESKSITYREAFTCNLSVKASDFWVLAGFDIHIHRWEDIDFAYRAHKRDFAFQYNPGALAYHNHPISFREYCRKMYDHYFVSVPLFTKHPGMIDHFMYLADKRPIHWGQDSMGMICRKVARRLIAFTPVLYLTESLTALIERLYGKASLLRFLYWKIIASYELRGLQDGFKEYRVSL